jgi:hypothetical protein
MSWGYFLDLNLTIPTAEWERVAQTKTSDHAIGAGWWGFKDKVLGEMFSASEFDDMTIGEVVALFDRVESIGKVDVNGDTTTIRLCQLLDRGGEPSIAKSVAALVDASKDSANATLRLINDGSYSGEDGVEIVAADGQLSRSHVEGSNELAMKLGSEIYGSDIAEGEINEDELDLAFEGATVDKEEMATGEGAQILAAAVAADQAGGLSPDEVDALSADDADALSADDADAVSVDDADGQWVDEAAQSVDEADAQSADDADAQSADEPATKRPMAKKASTKKPAAQKATAKKSTAKAAAKKSTAKAAANKSTAKAAAKKSTAKAAAKKSTAKAAAKKSSTNKSAAKKPPTKNATTKKAAAKKPAAKKAATSKAAAKKPAAEKPAAKKKRR